MAHLLRIDSSLRGEGSFSRSVADTFQNAWQQAHPDGTVTLRELGRDPLPYLTWEAYIAWSVPEAERTPEQQEAVARSAALVDELLAADHAEPYLRRVLADVLGLDLLVITPELTLADVNPALAQFIDRHRVSLAEAHGTAATAGRELVGQLAA